MTAQAGGPTLLRPSAPCRWRKLAGRLLSGIPDDHSPSSTGASGRAHPGSPTLGSSRFTSSSPRLQRKLVPARRINWPRMPFPLPLRPPMGWDPNLQRAGSRVARRRIGGRLAGTAPRLRQRAATAAREKVPALAPGTHEPLGRSLPLRGPPSRARARVTQVPVDTPPAGHRLAACMNRKAWPAARPAQVLSNASAGREPQALRSPAAAPPSTLPSGRSISARLRGQRQLGQQAGRWFPHCRPTWRAGSSNTIRGRA